ncbi:unnamed protein product [Lactuca saligna]|uniref:Uncharacterized protein n=1 Tax=Lactuca saligna TaxID=75948 RepID=A0AA35YUT1_LACSI|nr:unnamed protein product [Lactuca saligna]
MSFHAPKEEKLIFCDLAGLFSGKNSAHQDTMGNVEAWVNDGGCFISTGARKYPSGDFRPKVGFVSLTKRITMVVSEAREVAGVGGKIAGKWRDGGGSAQNYSNESKRILGGVCREWKMVKNGGGLM